tara:strand:- start:1548 stop:1799 length:252 start_codon:yes stop_codon:yes gene_type:complete
MKTIIEIKSRIKDFNSDLKMYQTELKKLKVKLKKETRDKGVMALDPDDVNEIEILSDLICDYESSIDNLEWVLIPTTVKKGNN